MPTVTPATILFELATGATTSSAFNVYSGNTGVRLYGAAAVIAGAETVKVQYQDAGGNWIDLVDAIVGACTIAAGETSVTIAQRGQFRVVKSVTAALVGVEIIDNNPS